MLVIVEKVMESMKEKGLTRKKLSEISDVPLPTINAIFNGSVQDPRYVTITQLCKATNVSVDGTVGIVSPDMGAEEIASIKAEHELTKEALDKSREEHSRFMEHKQDMIALLTKESEELNDRVKYQKRAIFWLRVGIAAAVIYGLVMDFLNPALGIFQH